MINKINEIIDEKEQYQLQAIRFEAENTALKAILTKRDESVTEQTKIILNLEAENKTYKANADAVQKYITQNEQLKTHIDGLEKKNAKLIAENDKLKRQLEFDSRYNDMQAEIDYGERIIEKYKNVLQEIKEIALLGTNTYKEEKEPNSLSTWKNAQFEKIIALIAKAEEE